MFFLVLYFSTKNTRVALLVALAFLVSMQGLRMFEQPVAEPATAEQEQSDDESDADGGDDDQEEGVNVAEDDAPANNASQDVTGYDGSVSGANY